MEINSISSNDMNMSNLDRDRTSNRTNNNMDMDEDFDDLDMFSTVYGNSLARQIIRIKNNDSHSKKLWLSMSSSLQDASSSDYRGTLNIMTMSQRLGCILGQNSILEDLVIRDCNNILDVTRLFDGLRNNQSIKQLCLHDINLRNNEKMFGLQPVLSSNPILIMIALTRCNINASGIDILSNALSQQDTLEIIDLRGNRFGDSIDLDNFVQVLGCKRRLRRLNLDGNGIGFRGCAPLAKLLANEESNLNHLSLSHNSIDNASSITLTRSLSRNTKLTTLDLLGNNSITKSGWLAMLKLVYNNSSIFDLMLSNHTLADLGLGAKKGLSPEKATYLRKALNFNKDDDDSSTNSDKMGEISDKIFSYLLSCKCSRGEVNIGDSPLVTSFIPTIIGWINGDSNNRFNSFYKLDLIHQILLSRPDLVSQSGHIIKTTNNTIELDGKRKANEITQPHVVDNRVLCVT